MAVLQTMPKALIVLVAVLACMTSPIVAIREVRYYAWVSYGRPAWRWFSRTILWPLTWPLWWLGCRLGWKLALGQRNGTEPDDEPTPAEQPAN